MKKKPILPDKFAKIILGMINDGHLGIYPKSKFMKDFMSVFNKDKDTSNKKK